MATTSPLRVGFLGVGQLGAPVLARIVEAGWPVTAHDPRPEALAPFGDGLTAVGSAAEVAAASDMVSLLVNDEQQVRDAMTGPTGLLAGARPGLIVAVHSTIGHDVLREVADAATAAGVVVLDAPLSGTMGAWSIPDLCVMIGGDAAAAEAVRPVFESFAGLIVHLGPLGSGMDAKLARNAICYQWYEACHEGLSLAEAAGIPRETMTAILHHTGLTGFFPGAGSIPGVEPLDPEVALARGRHQLAVAQKDVSAALARADELGVPMPLAEAGHDAVAGFFLSIGR